MENCLLKGSTHRCRGVTHGMNRTWSAPIWTDTRLPVIAFTSPIGTVQDHRASYQQLLEKLVVLSRYVLYVDV